MDLPSLPFEPLRTERLVLRQWVDSDREPYAALNADAETMAYFPSTLSRDESDAMVGRIQAGLERNGWGLWAVEHECEFLGFTGLAVPSFDAAFTPAVEVGWRFARSAWGKGFATEAARAAVAFGYGRLGLAEIVSFTTVANQRSRRVMERIGMTTDPADDFLHPRLDEGSPIRPHVLYRLAAPTV
jgi:RimJ/RimL family protein N-acetyltransferase